MKKMLLRVAGLFGMVLFLWGCHPVSETEMLIPPPSFDNNPQWDMILTNSRPVLSVGNPSGIKAPYTIEFQISADSSFPEGSTMVYKGIKPENDMISEIRLRPEDSLVDGRYYWRARTVVNAGGVSSEHKNHGRSPKPSDGMLSERTSNWVTTRFSVDVTNSRTFSGFLRVPVESVMVSDGQDPANIIDWNDQGHITYWNSAPSSGKPFSWVMLDMGKPVDIARFWMLYTRSTTPAPGWLSHFLWQSSNDGEQWADIPGTEVTGNDTYRNIIDFEPVGARYYRLVIYSQNALQAQINAIIPYIKGTPAVPEVPEADYVLLIGNQMNGYTYTDLAGFVQNRGYASVTIPHYEMSLDVLRNLRHKPVAIIFSGNNADWQYLPLFEYYGEYQIYREVYDIPMMGICAGNEFYAMAYGVSFAHWMGWFDDTEFRLNQGQKPEEIDILPEFADDPIFAGMPNPYHAVEIHSWAISPVSAKFMEQPEFSEFRITSQSSYIQTIKSMERPAYSEQFHGAAIIEGNDGERYLSNFLDIAKKWNEEHP